MHFAEAFAYGNDAMGIDPMEMNLGHVPSVKRASPTPPSSASQNRDGIWSSSASGHRTVWSITDTSALMRLKNCRRGCSTWMATMASRYTFRRVRAALGDAKHPAHYLAIRPKLFGPRQRSPSVVTRQQSKGGVLSRARVDRAMGGCYFLISRGG